MLYVLHDVQVCYCGARVNLLFTQVSTNTTVVPARPARVLGHLGDHGVASEDAGHDVVVHVVEGIVPRRDDAENPQRPAVNHVCGFQSHSVKKKHNSIILVK